MDLKRQQKEIELACVIELGQEKTMPLFATANRIEGSWIKINLNHQIYASKILDLQPNTQLNQLKGFLPFINVKFKSEADKSHS